MLLFDRYEYNPKSDLIGKGGFSRVYKAFDKKFNRFIALKVYKTTQLSERYSPIAEIQRVINLDHPNICRYLDIEEIEKDDSFGQTEKIQICIMELIDGGNFSTYYDLHKNFEVFKKLLFDVLKGLSYLHSNGIIHRDIKPANILIQQTPDGPLAKITDFGISKKSDSFENSSSSGLLVSIPYMAPEQLNAQKYGINEKIHFNIDLWSLGVAVYEIISGDILFKNSKYDASEQVMANIVTQELPEKIKSLPIPLNDLVSKCLVKDAKERVKTADELLEMLQPYLHEKIKPVLSSDEVNQEPENEILIDTNLQSELGKEKNSPDQQTELIINEDPLLNNEFTDDETKAIPNSLLTSLGKHTDINPEKANDSDETRIIEKPLDIAEISDVEKNSSKVDEKKDEPNFNIDETKVIEEPGEVIAKIPSVEKIFAQQDPKGVYPAFTGDQIKSNNTQGEKEKEHTKITLFNRYSYYPMTDLIGKGGFSRVYKAMDQKLSRWVALKIYKTSEFSDRYSPIAEIKRVVNLDQPNICRYLDIEEIEKTNPFGEVEKIQVCVMELLDSGNFSEYFNSTGKDLDVLKKLLQDVLNGISYLHKNGIIHRDIKPANILIKKTIEGPVAKITDFGISKVSDSINNNSSSALIVSIPYMAPEQLNIKRYGINEKISFNLDLWSLGVTIYEIITGNVLFKNSEQDSSEQIMANIMAPDLPEKINELPQPFRNIVSHCIVKNANERAQKAEELLVLLNSAKSDLPTIVQEVVSVPAPPLPIQKLPEIEIAKPEVVANIPEKQDQSVLQRKFIIAEPAPVVEKRAKKQITVLKISIIIAALLLILASIFYYANISKEEMDKSNVVVKKDTTTSLNDDNKILDTVKITSNENIKDSIVTKTKQKSKPIAPIKRSDTPRIKETNTQVSTEKFAVNFMSTKPCTVTKDGNFYMELSGTEQRYLNAGRYHFTATFKDGGTSVRNLDVSKNRGGRTAPYAVKF